MENEEFDNLINGIREKLGEENSAKIADDLGTLITNNTKQNSDLANRNTEIEKLTKDKENLITTNGNLLQQIAMQNKDDNFPDFKKEKKEEKPFSFKDQLDENGNFKD